MSMIKKEKCDECKTDMKIIGEFLSTTLTHLPSGLKRMREELYQCPNCKTIKTVSKI